MVMFCTISRLLCDKSRNGLRCVNVSGFPLSFKVKGPCDRVSGQPLICSLAFDLETCFEQWRVLYSVLTGASTQVTASNKTPVCRLVQAPVVVQLIIHVIRGY